MLGWCRWTVGAWQHMEGLGWRLSNCKYCGPDLAPILTKPQERKKVKPVRMGGVGQNGSRTTTRKRRLMSNQEPPMIDCHLVQRDQSLAPTKRANQNLVHKIPPYSQLGRDFPAPLCGPGTSPGCANLDKALYSSISGVINQCFSLSLPLSVKSTNKNF